jgi:hypothetical protein
MLRIGRGLGARRIVDRAGEKASRIFPPWYSCVEGRGAQLTMVVGIEQASLEFIPILWMRFGFDWPRIFTVETGLLKTEYHRSRSFERFVRGCKASVGSVASLVDSKRPSLRPTSVDDN